MQSIDWTGAGMKTNSDARKIHKINYDCRSVKEEWYQTLVIGDWPVKFKLDSGSDLNCIPLTIAERLGFFFFK